MVETTWEIRAELLHDKGSTAIMAKREFDDRERAEKVAHDMAQNDPRLFVTVWEITRRPHSVFTSRRIDNNEP